MAREPKVMVGGKVECCGHLLECPGFTNTCPHCGTDYNWGGQRLAPRCQWGEETSESVSDILSIDAQSTDDLLGG